MDLSVTETAIKGGDLGWINENVLSKEFKSKIITTKTGEISEPVILKEGIFIYIITKMVFVYIVLVMWVVGVASD